MFEEQKMARKINLVSQFFLKHNFNRKVMVKIPLNGLGFFLCFYWNCLIYECPFFSSLKLRVGLICFVTLDRQWTRATLSKLNIWDSRLVFKRLITESRKLTESSRMFFVIVKIVAHFSFYSSFSMLPPYCLSFCARARAFYHAQDGARA